MKMYRNVAIVIAVLIVLVGAYLIINNINNNPVEDDDSLGNTSDIIRIFDLDSSKIVEITIDNGDSKLVFKKDDEVWVAVNPENLKIVESSIRSIAINIASLTADKIIEEEAEDVSQYGLDKPVVVSFKTDEGTVEVIEIGDETPTGSGYYVKRRDSNTVYTIYSYVGNKIKVSKNDVRDRVVFDQPIESITSFSMERSGQTVFTAEKTDDVSWKMTSPVKGEVNASAIGPMLDSMGQLTVREYIEENVSDLSAYGLKNPAYAIQIQTTAGSMKLILGNETGSSNEMYVMLEGNDEVFTVDTSLLTYLDKPIEEILEVFAYIVNISDVNKIETEIDGKTVTSTIETDEEDSDNDKFYIDGKDVSFENEKGDQPFRKYYQSLIGITLSKVEPEANPEGKPEITITYYLKTDPGTMKVEFISKDDRSYYVLRNGEYTGILVEKKKFDQPEGVRDSYKMLMEELEKQG